MSKLYQKDMKCVSHGKQYFFLHGKKPSFFLWYNAIYLGIYTYSFETGYGQKGVNYHDKKKLWNTPAFLIFSSEFSCSFHLLNFLIHKLKEGTLKKMISIILYPVYIHILLRTVVIRKNE